MLSGAEESDLVQLVACNFQDKAATMICRLEASEYSLETLLELQTVMMKPFVGAKRQTRGTTTLWAFKTSVVMDKHIKDFVNVMELKDASQMEAYNYCLYGLPGKYQKEFIKEFPTENCEKMDIAFDFARKFAFEEFDAEGASSKCGIRVRASKMPEESGNIAIIIGCAG